jgi:hypothetical protein
MIRTDGIGNQTISNMPSILPYDDNILYADLIAINDISFSNVSRITNNYSRTIRAGNAIDINSNGDASFEFDAEVGSDVDMKIIDFADTPEECQPVLDKSNDRTENENLKIQENINELQISPNPAHNSFKIEYYLEHNATINLWIIDFLGRTVKIVEQDVKKKKGVQNQMINIQDLPSGTYYVNLTINGKKITKPLIVTK